MRYFVFPDYGTIPSKCSNIQNVRTFFTLVRPPPFRGVPPVPLVSEPADNYHSLNLLSRAVFLLPSKLEEPMSASGSTNDAMPSLQSEGEHPFVGHYHSVVQRKKLKYAMVPEDEMQELMTLYGPENIVGREASGPAEHQQYGTIYRRFVRWNPNFFEYFELNSKTRKWEPNTILIGVAKAGLNMSESESNEKETSIEIQSKFEMMLKVRAPGV
jgi:hypothetical protein